MGRPKIEAPAFLSDTEVNTILQNPPDLAAWRQTLFELDPATEIHLSAEQYNTYFPYVSNVWTYQKRRKRKRDDVEVINYQCRLFAETWDSKVKPAPGSALRSIRTGRQCECTMKIEVYGNGDLYAFTRIGEAHSHTLDRSDELKRNDGLKSRVCEELYKNQEAAILLASLQGSGHIKTGRKQLVEAGGAYLNRIDINSWRTPYRKAFPDLRTTGQNDPWELQLDEAVEFLGNNKWLYEKIRCQKNDKIKRKGKKGSASIGSEMAHGVVFAQVNLFPNLLKNTKN